MKCILQIGKKKRKQSAYKPGSVAPRSRLSFIQSISCLMAQAFYPPTNNRAGSPDGVSLHELATPKMHSR